MASVTPEEDVRSGCRDVGKANRLKEMEGKWKIVKTLNNDLQEALEKSDVEVEELILELLTLQQENKCLKQEKNNFMDLMVEADNLKLSLRHPQNAECAAHQDNRELERRCLLLEEKDDELSGQIRDLEEENRILREDVTQLRGEAIKLENDLDEKNMELKAKDDLAQEREMMIEEMSVTIKQYSSTIEALNNKIQDFESQLEELYQERATRNTFSDFEDDVLNNNPEASSTMKYEMLQTRVEKQLELVRLAEEHQGRAYLSLRLPLDMVLQFLWCCFSVGFLLLLVFVSLLLYQSQYPDYPLLERCRDVASQSIEGLKNALHPYLKMTGYAPAPHQTCK